jgi:protein SCO1
MRSIRLPSLLCLLILGVAHAGSLAQGAFNASVFNASGPWLDDRNQPFRADTLHGTPAVVSMAYGACRRVCSTSLRMLEQLQGLADARGVALNFVVIGLDPAQDRPADWAAYRAERKLHRANWKFLSGDSASTARIAQRLGVRYWRYGEHTMHDFRIVLVSGQGRVVTSLTTPDQGLATLLR